MTYTPISMIPGPTQVSAQVREILSRDYGQREEAFIPLYQATASLLEQCMGITPNSGHNAVIMTGEGMLALWAGLKSCLQIGDKILAISTGVFGSGIGDMAKSIGCQVQTIELGHNATIDAEALNTIEAAVKDFKPKMITAVHCETPSGTLNPLSGLGELKKIHNVPLLYVDAVSSIGGALVSMNDWNIDVLLGGSQKCFSAPPSMSFLGISPKAWDIIEKINYAGYDALLPWKNAIEEKLCPYTPYLNGLAALHNAAQNLVYEGLENVFERHNQSAKICREGLLSLGFKLWAKKNAIHSPTVTAAYIPKNFTWEQWNTKLQDYGLDVGTSYGPMSGKVFRMGHMGEQAQKAIVTQAINIISKNI